MTATLTPKPIKLPAPSRGSVERRRAGEAASQECTACERELTICSYNVKSRSPWRRRRDCRECQARTSRAAYERNRSDVIIRSRAAKAQHTAVLRAWLSEFLSDRTCADCDVNAPDIFEFDHRHDAKRDSISRMISRGLSIATIEAEIAKCDILCPNCHRKRTQADQMSYMHRYMAGEALTGRYAQAWLDNIAYLQEHPCVDCDEDDLRVLEYDHVRGTKESEISTLLRQSDMGRIAAERAKCEVRCCNCHRRRSHNSRVLLVA